MIHGQSSRPMSLRSLPGLVLGSLHSSIIGSDLWLLNIIVLRNSFLAGPSTDRAPAGARLPQTNFSTLPSVGLEIPIHELERRGRRGRDSQSSSRIVELY